PLIIEVTRGTGDTADLAARYLDLVLPEGVATILTLTPQGIEDLRYDADGDGTYETSVAPTAAVSGAAANDLDAPTIAIDIERQQASVHVTLTTEDSSGVRSFVYSLDGTNFQP